MYSNKTHKAMDIFLGILKQNRENGKKGIYSVCTANADVIRACMLQAKADDSIIVIESTSNQVDQFGGYTGMTPSEFVSYVHSIAHSIKFPVDMILLGGDHLGPNAWQDLKAEKAMKNAEVLIEEYIKAGFLKIHIDTSMFCSDDDVDKTKPLDDTIVAERTSRLCRVAESAWEKFLKSGSKPVYIIGTEVPVPGGAKEKEDCLVPTNAEDADKTFNTIKSLFLKTGLDDAWSRVVALVVQPGVEFGDDQIFKYNPLKAKKLSAKVKDFDHLVYEAHSTDYQTESELKALVRDHFGILKVGPWLTFAYREALFALEAMEVEIFGEGNPELSNLKTTIENAMLSEPKYWEKYYPGDEKLKFFKRKYSFSDRLRYYWPKVEVQSAKERLFRNLEKEKIPNSLISQFMPVQFYQVCEGIISTKPGDLVDSYIQTVAGIYARACGISDDINGANWAHGQNSPVKIMTDYNGSISSKA